ncbi:MAG: hypothetical protein AAF492_27775, partial [Verrucomicrobiota bacterium]
KTPIVTFGLITENINRMVNVYRPFYYRKTGVKMTKPRFTLEGDRLTLLPNPIQHARDIPKLSDPGFVASLGANDWWYNRDNEPIFKFPYSKILLNRRMWLEARLGKDDREISDLDPRPWEDLWEDTHAPDILFGIIDAFVKEATDFGALPIVVIISKDYQVEDRVKNGEHMEEVQRIIEHCESKGYRYFDTAAALAKEIRFSIDARNYFRNHMNRKGNRVIGRAFAEYLREPMKEAGVESGDVSRVE